MIAAGVASPAPLALRSAATSVFKVSRVLSGISFSDLAAASRGRRIDTRCNLRRLQLGEALLLRDLTGMRRKARYGRDVHVGMRDRHQIVPDRRCLMAAGDSGAHRTVVVVAEPDAGHVLAGEAR